MRMKKAYLLIACLAVAAGLGLYYFLQDEAPPVQQPEPVQTTSNIVYSGNSIVEEQDGKRLWELSAGTIEIDPAANQARMNDLKGVFYQDNGGKLEIVALQAVYDHKSRDITMNGQIKATTTDGAAFTAGKARWSGADRRFYGSGGIMMTRDDTVIVGDQMESDVDMNKVTVTGNARIRKGGAGN
ncbi:LPS export ABC transporter protein LptC [Dendrosporobacter quercicolus]|uniref:LPS export ABC transporter protein LptC n=2 Tax=Dendrosporobacter quercicolus TaxID=146817 RepID=A0A1G9WKH2_9FIRM|nr:LPS export ABC transporter protein LptC [Dendrosporobacter quercicolus]